LDLIGKQELKIKGTCKQEPRNITRPINEPCASTWMKYDSFFSFISRILIITMMMFIHQSLFNESNFTFTSFFFWMDDISNLEFVEINSQGRRNGKVFFKNLCYNQ
jgi:hypothetical protein